MGISSRTCSICPAEADWVRVRKPNPAQMDCLCHRHYQSLRERNPLMASWYDNLAAVAPIEWDSLPGSEEIHISRKNM